ncbi:ubiquinol-cytochrome-c reductase complex assembly factor 4 [Centropristis striata]|uniref:ubiquinol-cytochrome-c reductase complex assembly factor 4 n=1 Tax=Centropristis striata TaxID=184440 RepID=UPI0027DECDCB|nr:ubiquinol-cytochrome-c reductase complex assembly factor 4 [Centropristis striata]
MSTTTGRVLSGLTRVAFSRGIFVHNVTPTVRLNTVRSLALSPHRSAESKDEEVISEPIKFSTSKGSHRTWRVDRSMGSQHRRPLWKVLPISIGFSVLLLWCALRSESDIDEKLEKQLYEHFPTSSEEEEEEQDKSEAS